MPNSIEVGNGITHWLDWVVTCVAMPMSTPLCRPLWEWVVYACIAGGVFLVGRAVWHLVSYRFKYKAAMQAEDERQRVAEPEVMEQHMFKEVGDVVADVTDPHLAEKIREELDRQKLERIAGNKTNR